MTHFHSKLEKCNLIDLGYKDPSFTWSNKRLTNKHSLIRERLHRFLCNEKWLNCFSNSTVFHLFSPASDHMPILLTLQANVVTATPFRFESMWPFDPTFPNIISQYLKDTTNYFQNIKKFTANVKSQNTKSFWRHFLQKRQTFQLDSRVLVSIQINPTTPILLVSNKT